MSISSLLVSGARAARVAAVVCVIAALGAGSASAQNASFRLVAVRALEPAQVRASGRIVPMFSAMVGARIEGQIVVWGTDAAGRPLDVGLHVAKDAELFRIDAAMLEARAAGAHAALITAQARVADLTAGTRPERVAALAAMLAEVDARIEEMHRDEDRFRRLVEDDKTMAPKKLEEARAQIAVATAQRAGAAARLAEAKAGATATELAIANSALREAEAAVAMADLDVRDAVVRAPFAAVIVRREKGLGDYVNHAPFTPVVELVADGDVEAELRLPESALNELKPGTTLITLESPLLDAPVALPVDRIAGTVDPREGVIAFRVRVPAAQRGRLLPGAFVQGLVALPRAAGSVIVPRAAVVEAGGIAAVFVNRGGTLRRAVVVVGERMTDEVILRSGVLPTDQIAVGPRESLVDGAAAPTSQPAPAGKGG